MALSNVGSLSDLTGKVVLLRVDYNVAIDSSSRIDNTKLLFSISTIKFLLQNNAKVVLISHFGSKVDCEVDKLHSSDNKSLEIILSDIESILNMEVQFIKAGIFDLKKDEFLQSSNNLFLLENIRFYEGEVDNSFDFAHQLASLGDIFVNEAFSASHREHASIVLLPKFLKTYFGFHFIQEVNEFSGLLKEENSLAIIGGNKIKDKIKLIKILLDREFKVFLAGAIGTTIQRLRNCNDFVGDSETKEIAEYLSSHKNIILPSDFILYDGDNLSKINDCSQILGNQKVVDCGRGTINKIKNILKKIKFVLWNGPIGIYENSKFATGTKKLINVLKKYTKLGGKTVLGGGHTVAAVKNVGSFKDFTYVSSSGGAFLHFLSKKTLPGIDAAK